MPTPPQRETRAPVLTALVTVQVLFGINYLASKVVLEEIPPRAWALLRVSGACLLLWCAIFLLRRRLPRDPADYAKLALFSLFGVVFNQVLFVEGLSRTTPIHSSLINTSIPVLTLVFATLAGREGVTARKVGALAMAFVGVMFVLRPDRAGLDSRLFVGDLLTLANATSFSLFLVISKRVLSRIDPLAATALLFSFGSVGILALGGGPLVRADLGLVTSTAWWAALFVIIGPTAGTYLLNYWALARVDSSMVALFIYLQPLIAGLLSVTLRGERPELTTLFGGALICVGVYLSVMRKRR